MEELIRFIEQSVADHAFSRVDKKELKQLLAAFEPDQNDLNFLRSKLFDLAMAKANAENYGLVLGWLEGINKTLVPTQIREHDDQVFFSPGNACRNAIQHQIKTARDIMRICVFTISDDLITRDILGAHERGVEVRLLTDNDKLLDLGSDIKELARKGVDVKVDYTRNHMHHKFAIFDKETLLTGSYNWTRSAAKYNHENLLLTKEKASIHAYLNEFDKLWREMETFHG